MALQKQISLLFIIILLIQNIRSQFQFGSSYCYPASKCIKNEFGNATNIDLGYCGAAFSCHNATANKNLRLTDFGWGCAATHSCSLNTVTAPFDYYCGAVASCASLTIIPPLNTPDHSSYDMDCDADQSCSHSFISATNYIRASGAYSLFNSIVDSVNCTIPRGKSYHLSVSLTGYRAGLGAKIICRHNHSCNIDCHANGCFNLSLQCDGSCQVNTQSDDTILPIYVDQIDMVDPDPFNHGFNLLYDAYLLSLQNDEECSKLHRNFTFDDYDEALGVRSLHLSGGIQWDQDIPVCCRGSWACEDVYNVIKSEFMDQRTVCSGELACIYDEHIFNYNGNIYCESTKSCYPGSRGVTVNTSKTLYCWGLMSCDGKSSRRLDLHNAERFICSGRIACKQSNIFSSGLNKTHYIYFFGESSGESANIHCRAGDTCHILCWAFNACAGTQLICDGDCIIECDADSSCPYDSVSQQYFYPTSAPTMEPTIDPTPEPSEPTMEPTTEPTIDPTAEPTTDPTADPTTEPTVDPTADPITDPTTDPTIDPTADPTADPTTDPTAFMNTVSLAYTAYIVLDQHDIDAQDAVLIENTIITAFYNTSIRLLSTEVMRNGVVSLDILIATHHNLDSEDVSELLERELKDDLGDVHVSVVEEDDDDETPANDKTNWFYSKTATNILCGVIIITLICSICCYLQQRQKSQLTNHRVTELMVALEAMQKERDDARSREKEKPLVEMITKRRSLLPKEQEEENEEATIEGSDHQYEDEGNVQRKKNDKATDNVLSTSHTPTIGRVATPENETMHNV